MRRAARIALVMIGLVGAVYLAICAGLFFVQRSLLYYPQPRSNTTASTLLTLQAATGTLNVSARPHDGPNAVIYFGGNAEDVSQDMPSFVDAFSGYAIYLLHYPGYGGSSGSPTEQAIVADAFALYDTVHARHSNVVLIGRSLGSGVAVHVASERAVTRLVLVTPYDSMGDAAANQYPLFPVRWLLRDKYASWRYAPLVKAPTTMLVAADDELVPRASSERLRTRFKEGLVSYVLIPGVGHNSISESRDYLPLLAGSR